MISIMKNHPIITPGEVSVCVCGGGGGGGRGVILCDCVSLIVYIHVCWGILYLVICEKKK